MAKLGLKLAKSGLKLAKSGQIKPKSGRFLIFNFFYFYFEITMYSTDMNNKRRTFQRLPYAAHADLYNLSHNALLFRRHISCRPRSTTQIGAFSSFSI